MLNCWLLQVKCSIIFNLSIFIVYKLTAQHSHIKNWTTQNSELKRDTRYHSNRVIPLENGMGIDGAKTYSKR